MFTDFEEIYKANYGVVYGFLLNLCKNPDLAEELAAESFYKAFTHHKSFDGKVKTSTWLCQIAKNEYFRHLKRQKKLTGLERAEGLEAGTSIEEIVADSIVGMDIHKQLHKLEEPYKEVFVLRVFAQLSFKEIGLIFERSEVWARVTYYRAKSKIMERMAERE